LYRDVAGEDVDIVVLGETVTVSTVRVELGGEMGGADASVPAGEAGNVWGASAVRGCEVEVVVMAVVVVEDACSAEPEEPATVDVD
jgi:hypothetical protein